MIRFSLDRVVIASNTSVGSFLADILDKRDSCLLAWVKCMENFSQHFKLEYRLPHIGIYTLKPEQQK